MDQWLFPCNPDFYDVISAFNSMNKINWKQSRNVSVGDTVYIYIGKPYQEIRYQTTVIESDLSHITIKDSKFVKDGTNFVNHGRYMTLELTREFNNRELIYQELIQNGLGSVQGPAKVSEQLESFINSRKKLTDANTEQKYFFVFQNQSYKEEKAGQYLWAPQSNLKKHNRSYWQRMTEVKKGDIILHSVDRKIKAISIAQTNCLNEDRPPELKEIWTTQGWKVSSKYYELEEEFNISDHIDRLMKLQPTDNGPFNVKGNRKQGYLFSANKAMFDYIMEEVIKVQKKSSNRSILRELLEQQVDIEERLDQELVDGIDGLIEAYVNQPVDYKPQHEPKPQLDFLGKKSSYKRNKEVAIKALKRANYECEIDKSHPSFKRRTTKVNYTEPHHLIPMAKQGNFSYSLDVEANIVSLCSNCHNQIHYGADYKEMISKLHIKREKELTQAGIQIDLGTLIEYY